MARTEVPPPASATGAIEAQMQMTMEQMLVEVGTEIDSTSGNGIDGQVIFKPPAGIGYVHEPGETYARIDSKLGRGIQILVPPRGPFPNIPRDTQRVDHQATRDRVLVVGDVKTIQRPSEKQLRDRPAEYPGFRGFWSPVENFSQPVNEKHEPPVYEEGLMRQSLGPVLSERYIHEDHDVRAQIPAEDLERANTLVMVLRDAAIIAGLMTEEEAGRLITVTRVLRYDDEEIMAEVAAGNIELLPGAREQDINYVMGDIRILDSTRPVQPIPRRRSIKIREKTERKKSAKKAVSEPDSTRPVAASQVI